MHKVQISKDAALAAALYHQEMAADHTEEAIGRLLWPHFLSSPGYRSVILNLQRKAAWHHSQFRLYMEFLA